MSSKRRVYTQLTFCVHEDIPTNYELLSGPVAFIVRVTSYFYCTSSELPFTFDLRVIFYCASYNLIFGSELRVTAYCTNCVFYMRVASYCLLHDLRVTFNYELRQR